MPPAPPATTKAVGTPWVLPWPLLPPEAESDLLLSGFHPPPAHHEPFPVLPSLEGPRVARTQRLCVHSHILASRSPALEERWRQQTTGGSGPQVPFFVPGSLETFPQAGGEESVNFTLQNNLCPLFLILRYDCVIQGGVLGTREQSGASPAFSSSAPMTLLFPLTRGSPCHSQEPYTKPHGAAACQLHAQRQASTCKMSKSWQH